MQYRTLGKTGFKISEVSLGTWQVGGKWGSEFSYENADEILNKAVDLGVNFIGPADQSSCQFRVYGRDTTFLCRR